MYLDTCRPHSPCSNKSPNYVIWCRLHKHNAYVHPYLPDRMMLHHITVPKNILIFEYIQLTWINDEWFQYQCNVLVITSWKRSFKLSFPWFLDGWDEFLDAGCIMEDQDPVARFTLWHILYTVEGTRGSSRRVFFFYRGQNWLVSCPGPIQRNHGVWAWD